MIFYSYLVYKWFTSVWIDFHNGRRERFIEWIISSYDIFVCAVFKRVNYIETLRMFLIFSNKSFELAVAVKMSYSCQVKCMFSEISTALILYVKYVHLIFCSTWFTRDYQLSALYIITLLRHFSCFPTNRIFLPGKISQVWRKRDRIIARFLFPTLL